MSTHALASLTATYTDSEPEDENNAVQEEEEEEEEENAKKKSPVSPDAEIEKVQESNHEEIASVPQDTEISTKVTQLVSYHDDNFISDEEGEYFFHSNELDPDELEEQLKLKDDAELPAEPTGRCSPRLLERVMKLHEKIESGIDMNNMIQSRKDFRNPSIYEKLIQFCNLNELGTNYPASIYDPLKWGKESFYEELAKVQKFEMDRREKEKKERTKVEFVSGTKKTNSSLSSEDELKKRKSKWDQVGASAGGNVTVGMIGPAGLLQPSLTSTVTGTKGTVISAFGSLPKKPRL